MKRFLLFTCAIMIVSLRARAESERNADGEPTTITLVDVLASVDRQYPLIIAAFAEHAEARAMLLHARGGFDPSLRASAQVEPIGGYPKQQLQMWVEQPTPFWGTSLFAGYRLGLGDFAVYDGRLQTNEHGEVRGGVRVPLWRDGPIDRRRALVSQGEIGVEVARLGVHQQRIEARRLASIKYWEWAGSRKRLQIFRDWLELAKSRDEAIRIRVEHGDVPNIERVENQRAILQREAALRAAERDAIQSAIELSLFVRTAEGRPRVLDSHYQPETFPEPTPVREENVRRLTSIALSRRPDLKRLELQRNRTQVDATLARNQQAPALDVNASGSKDLGPGNERRGRGVVEVGVFLDIPILNRQQRGKELAATASIARIDEQLRLARDRVQADVHSAVVSVRVAMERAEINSRELAVAKELAHAELERFHLGESTLLLVNLREQASAEAELRQVEALLDYHRSVANYRASLGELDR